VRKVDIDEVKECIQVSRFLLDWTGRDGSTERRAL
jgi:hypothetical protein